MFVCVAVCAEDPLRAMLVYTDIEDSTKAAAEYPAAMIVVQEVHDRVMRQGIQRFAGRDLSPVTRTRSIFLLSTLLVKHSTLWLCIASH